MSVLSAKVRLRRRAWFALWAAPLPIWFALFFMGPMLLLIAMSFWSVQNYRLTPDFSLSAWSYVLSLDFLWSTFWRSYGLSLISAALVSLLAFPASYAMAFLITPARRLTFLGLALAPFFTSYLVRIYSLQVFLGEGGVLPQLFHSVGLSGASLLNSYTALFLGHATLTLPVVLVLQTLALGNVDRTEMSAAVNLGARPQHVLRHIILPAARPGLSLGVLFAFLLSYAEFVSATYLGGGVFQTLPILLTDLIRGGQQWPRAAVVSLLMMAALMLTSLVTVAWAYRQKGN
ncbi:ABC transporter permease [Celeribacter baekdonensis]|uniref:Binding-protein-dependent transport system inner membrane protein n=1 Tax=Celeribacter baekdonensis B30 TaxID=1208323 RepID=K2J7M2_9RHOB|nr:ABC transporter permease [Celeribacter baekdonensis]EKE71138.1 binding-protein-dependent transport system inner membrane protein [Celeribacter baekdonensis B30]